jgi:hypothetical protein
MSATAELAPSIKHQAGACGILNLLRKEPYPLSVIHYPFLGFFNL